MKTKQLFVSTIEAAKKHKITALFACALVTGLVAAWGIRSQIGVFLAEERAKLIPKVKTVEVVVAKRHLKAGDIVSGDSMAVRPVPQEFVPSSAIRPDKFDGFIGAKLNMPLQSGEPLLGVAIAGADVATFSSKVKPGIRAMTVVVDEVNSVSGMLQPGDHIDLLLSVKPPPSHAQGAASTMPEITAPFLQDILVLATGKQVRPGQGDEQNSRAFNAITVEVSPEQAQRLVVAQRGGKLTAMLRNPGDHHELPKLSLDIYALLGLRPPPLQPASGQPLAAPTPVAPRAAASLPAAAPQSQAASGLSSTTPVNQAPPFAPPQAVTQATVGTEIIVGGRGPIARSSAGPLEVPVEPPPQRPMRKSEPPNAATSANSSAEQASAQDDGDGATASFSTRTPNASVLSSKASPLSGPVSQTSLPQSLIEVR
jgi:pilus assembly protein CpaB